MGTIVIQQRADRLGFWNMVCQVLKPQVFFFWQSMSDQNLNGYNVPGDFIYPWKSRDYLVAADLFQMADQFSGIVRAYKGKCHFRYFYLVRAACQRLVKISISNAGSFQAFGKTPAKCGNIKSMNFPKGTACKVKQKLHRLRRIIWKNGRAGSFEIKKICFDRSLAWIWEDFN